MSTGASRSGSAPASRRARAITSWWARSWSRNASGALVPLAGDASAFTAPLPPRAPAAGPASRAWSPPGPERLSAAEPMPSPSKQRQIEPLGVSDRLLDGEALDHSRAARPSQARRQLTVLEHARDGAGEAGGVTRRDEEAGDAVLH